MSLGPYKTWIAGEVLTAADLNASFSNILTNATTLISPLTANLDLDGNALILDEDGDLTMVSTEDDFVRFQIGGVNVLSIDADTPSLVNGLVLFGSATSNPVVLIPEGSDADIDLVISGKAAGAVELGSTLDLDGEQFILDTDGDLKFDTPSDDVLALQRNATQIFKYDLSVSGVVNGYTCTGTATGVTPSITAQGTDSNIDLALNGKGTGKVSIDGFAPARDSLRNYISNSQFRYWQRSGPTVTSTGSANNDDVYFADRWIILSDGNDIVDITRESTTVPSRSSFACRLDVETQDKKFGIFQPLEFSDAVDFRGTTASLTFQARITNSSISAIRVGIVQWTSTADAITSDIVSAWNGAGTNPTLVANWAFANTPAALTALSTSYQTYTLDAVSISASATNIGLFIWTDDVTMTVGDFLYIGEVGLYRSAKAPTYNYVGDRQDLTNCLRFYEKTFDLDTVPGEGASSAVGSLRVHLAGTVAFQPVVWWKFSVPKRYNSYTVALFNSRAAGTDGQWDNGAASLANARAIQGTPSGIAVDNTGVTTTTAGQFLIDATCDAEL